MDGWIDGSERGESAEYGHARQVIIGAVRARQMAIPTRATRVQAMSRRDANVAARMSGASNNLNTRNA